MSRSVSRSDSSRAVGIQPGAASACACSKQPLRSAHAGRPVFAAAASMRPALLLPHLRREQHKLQVPLLACKLQQRLCACACACACACVCACECVRVCCSSGRASRRRRVRRPSVNALRSSGRALTSARNSTHARERRTSTTPSINRHTFTCVAMRLLTASMNTSNSSIARKGHSVNSPSARINATVV